MVAEPAIYSFVLQSSHKIVQKKVEKKTVKYIQSHVTGNFDVITVLLQFTSYLNKQMLRVWLRTDVCLRKLLFVILGKLLSVQCFWIMIMYVVEP